MIISSSAQKVINTLNRNGFEAFLVGGCVRDFLMNRPCADYDITTNALPEDVLRLFAGGVLPTGVRHGTVTVMLESPVEVTSYRVDGDYNDMRHPDRVRFTSSLAEDLARRDFTVNAVAYNPQAGFVDPFDGIGDIKAGVLRTVGEPRIRFKEDALRIARGVRFCSQLGFAVEDHTAKALMDMAGSLAFISSERKYCELKKILMGKNVLSALLEFPQVVCAIIPQMSPSVGFEQHSRHHDFDVYTHMCRAVAACEVDETLRLAALLHDIDKPLRFSMDERGGHFYGHPASGAETARKVLSGLRADNKTIAEVTELIKNHDDPLPNNRADMKRLLGTLGCDAFFRLMSLKRADHMAKRRAPEPPAELENARRLAQDIINNGECFSLDTLAVNGGDLKELGYKGKAVGDELMRLLDMVITEEIPNDKALICNLLSDRKV